jgi:exodeoxyribonuclease V beta subunit
VKEFNLLDSPLEGISLIEAAAGTGKTHTISRIFLRLLLEKQLTVDQILVVTFTEAATEELKDRIRNIISDALAAFNAGKSGDCFLSGLISRYHDAEPARQHLTLALRSFDEAAIYTIHGFCRRVLHDNAFESASFFETELITDQEPLLQEVVDDFWRKFITPSRPLFLAYLLRNLSIDGLFRLVKSYISRPFLTIIPSGIDRDSRAEESAYLRALDRVIDAWQSCRDGVAEILYNDDILNQNK